MEDNQFALEIGNILCPARSTLGVITRDFTLLQPVSCPVFDGDRQCS